MGWAGQMDNIKEVHPTVTMKGAKGKGPAKDTKEVLKPLDGRLSRLKERRKNKSLKHKEVNNGFMEGIMGRQFIKHFRRKPWKHGFNPTAPQGPSLTFLMDPAGTVRSTPDGSYWGRHSERRLLWEPSQTCPMAPTGAIPRQYIKS
ncbi:hypothetical protein QJS10_CPA10g01405 [Acorus calamus]|uniref:Uncharacterized protein n=1 Tax=Acorus calamus TaxID=4465 RepID=A0AAV9DXI2_ACOCL|nr:hypothetical protein QJS10_CPA10g01405 [Acorus calamus]